MHQVWVSSDQCANFNSEFTSPTTKIIARKIEHPEAQIITKRIDDDAGALVADLAGGEVEGAERWGVVGEVVGEEAAGVGGEGAVGEVYFF